MESLIITLDMTSQYLADKVSKLSAIHTEARFVPDSPLPKLFFGYNLLPYANFLKLTKNVSVHVSL